MAQRVIILGAGFGGLFAAWQLAGKPLEVLLVDRNNFHTFTPLLYQVATCALDPSEIAYPVRGIFHDKGNIRFLLGEVTAIDPQNRTVTLKSNSHERRESYDYLIVATGSTPTYFGNDVFREHALELRTLEDAVKLRNHIVKRLERAAWQQDNPAEQAALTTIVVVGGGPTGLETAGAIYELYNHVLQKEFRQYPDLKARVILVEALPHLLAPYPDRLRKSALNQLQSLGVEVILENPVREVAVGHVTLNDGTVIPTHTLIWSAGVKASPVADMLGVELQKNGTIPIEPTTEVKGLERVFAVGDIAYLPDLHGQPYPMLIPVAKQQGVLAAKNILRHINGEEQQPFKFIDRGIMATIGRRRAVAWLYYKIQLTGFIAWMAWLGLHIVTLMGFRNRLNVFVNWMWNYLTYDRSVRILLEPEHTED
ncbi:MAG: NAD(P)/FAD-dependent oxidoreductase [Anaerolineae bacterium]|nr:NAD(P)/FAD-dependent oxidoreductase [Anaerolineae bacterium]